MPPENRDKLDRLCLEMITELRDDFVTHTLQESKLNEDLLKAIDVFSSGSTPEIQRKRNEYLDCLIDKEKKRADFRQAVIEKTVSSLVWAMLVGLGYSVMHYLFPTRW